ncbi:response regulator [Segetibacter koreensis]|uniref:response regulator n=1 Tax=Segetibacter koreensis TaxID=398037 RepID=UPI00035F34F9|nr:response regulator [Segetibacter koreensis]
MKRLSNVLIAGDHSADLLFFTESLAKISDEGRVTQAKSGLECMSFLKDGTKPDIIFLDLNMPGYNGLYCLKYIKSKPHLANIPVIIYSTSHYIKDIDACFKNEAHYYIVKPASGDDLLHILKQVMNNLNENMQRPGKEKFVARVSSNVKSLHYF